MDISALHTLSNGSGNFSIGWYTEPRNHPFSPGLVTSRDTVVSSMGTHQTARTILGFHHRHGDVSISIALDDATEELRDGSEDVLLVLNVMLDILEKEGR